MKELEPAGTEELSFDEADTVTADDEILVAYLDGELPRDERGDLEQRLVNEESLRARLQSLQKGWDLLDLLPSPVTTEYAVQSTLELVVDDIRRYSNASLDIPADSKASSSPHPPKKQATGLLRQAWFLPLVVLAVAFAIASWMNWTSSQTQVADFPVAIDMEAYSIAGNTALIEDLTSSTRWQRYVAKSVIPDVEALIAVEGEGSMFPSRSLTESIPSQHQLTRSLAEVPTEQRMISLSRLERFEQLDPDAKQSLRRSANKLRQSPTMQKQLETLRAYARWREQLSDELVDAIESESGREREAAIDEAIAETITSIGLVTSRNLSQEAIERIDFTLIQIVKTRLDGEMQFEKKGGKSAPTQRLTRFLKQRGELLDDPDAAYRMVAARIVFRNVQREPRDPKREIPPLSTSELELIEAMLPAKDAETLQRYVSDPWVRALILEDWAQETIRRKTRGQIKAVTLPERYQSLPAEQKDVVDLMAPDQARRWLMEMAP